MSKTSHVSLVLRLVCATVHGKLSFCDVKVSLLHCKINLGPPRVLSYSKVTNRFNRALLRLKMKPFTGGRKQRAKHAGTLKSTHTF